MSNGSPFGPRRLQRDVKEIVDYLLDTAGEARAARFLVAIRETAESVMASPGLGSSWETDDPQLTGLRYLPVKRFKKYLHFYLPTEEGIEVIRVLHSARDIDNILG